MTEILNITNSSYFGQPQYTIYYQTTGEEPICVPLPAGVWDKDSIVDSLIRSKYPQDKVEAIVNNHFLNIAEWLDRKFAGSTESFIDIEYDSMQEWRKISKDLAVKALEMYPAI